ncbi:MAG: hypothetical protein ABH822_00250 [Patescibacteria group bacterium]
MDQIPAGLFERIISAIKKEQESRQRQRLMFGFSALSLLLITVTPFTTIALVSQLSNSGIWHFIPLLVEGGQNALIAILESLPAISFAAFIANIALALFILRLFIRKKNPILTCLKLKYE